MGRCGNPYDNAKAESFMKTLKVEGVYPMAFETFADVLESLPRFIEETDNRRWLHAALGYLSSAQSADQHTRLMVKPAARSRPPRGAHSNPGSMFRFIRTFDADR